MVHKTDAKSPGQTNGCPNSNPRTITDLKDCVGRYVGRMLAAVCKFLLIASEGQIIPPYNNRMLLTNVPMCKAFASLSTISPKNIPNVEPDSPHAKQIKTYSHSCPLKGIEKMKYKIMLQIASWTIVSTPWTIKWLIITLEQDRPANFALLRVPCRRSANFDK